jgi:LysR family transcriptional regulator, hydrogen peroxide-inducible genes activator
MNFQQLRYVIAVSELSSFGEAAGQCHVTQPTLSNGIAQFEAELGEQIFERTTRSVKQTEFGSLILPRIKDILNAQAQLLATAHSATNPTQQHVNIGVSPIFGSGLANAILEPFRKSHPQVTIVFRELNLAEMLRMLAAGELDFVFGPFDPMAKAEDTSSRVAFFEEELRFITQSDKRHQKQFLSLKEVAAYSLLLVPDACGLTQLTRTMFRNHKLKIDEYAGQAMSYNILLDWALLGIGATILPLSKLPKPMGAQIQLGKTKPSIAKIGYQVKWQHKAKLAPQVIALTDYLKTAAPQFANGLHNSVRKTLEDLNK